MPSTIRDPYHRRHFDPDLTPGAPPDIGRPWWEPLAEWPAGMAFDDVADDLLVAERELDQNKLGPPRRRPALTAAPLRGASPHRSPSSISMVPRPAV